MRVQYVVDPRNTIFVRVRYPWTLAWIDAYAFHSCSTRLWIIGKILKVWKRQWKRQSYC